MYILTKGRRLSSDLLISVATILKMSYTVLFFIKSENSLAQVNKMLIQKS